MRRCAVTFIVHWQDAAFWIVTNCRVPNRQRDLCIVQTDETLLHVLTRLHDTHSRRVVLFVSPGSYGSGHWIVTNVNSYPKYGLILPTYVASVANDLQKQVALVALNPSSEFNVSKFAALHDELAEGPETRLERHRRRIGSIFTERYPPDQCLLVPQHNSVRFD